MDTPVNPLTKVFSIIETVVTLQDKGATYSDILAVLDLPKSTVHRTLKDLCDIGYITFNPESKRYFGSMRLAKIGAEVMANFQLRKHIRPFLEDLHNETKFTTNLAIQDGTTGVFVDKIEAKNFGIKLFSELGKTFPLYCTGMGKVFLAYSSESVVNELLNTPLDAITEKTITDADRLKQELSQVREQGYAIDNEEITRGIICVAAPVFKNNQELVAAISVTLPAYVAKEQGGLESVSSAVMKSSRIISQSLGN